MKNSIMSFLAFKETSEYKKDEDKFYDYPVAVVVKGKPDVLYIQDVRRTHNNGKHTLKVILLHSDGVAYIVTKTCIAPDNCAIDWDLVQCATTINKV